MRQGYLARLGDINGSHLANFPDVLHRPGHAMPQSNVPNSQAGTYSWLSQGDLHLPLSVPHAGVAMEAKNAKKESDDVDVMSTDSSSSSSSDSQ